MGVVVRRIFRVSLFVRGRSSLLILTIVFSLRLDVSGTRIAEQLVLALTLVCLVALPDVLAFTRRLCFLLQGFWSLVSFFVLLLYGAVLWRILRLLDCICLLFLGLIFVLGQTR